MKNLTIESAKKFLKDNGYFVDNLWSVHDVQKNYNCSPEVAQTVLSDVLKSDRINQEINESIGIVASGFDLPKKSKYFSVSGFWKDTKVKFSDMIIKESEEGTEADDGKIFYYGLTEREIATAISEGWKTDFEFTITSYKETTLN